MIAATLLVLALIGAGMVLGLAVAVMAFAAQLPRIKQEQYTRGLEKGRALAQANAMHDQIETGTPRSVLPLRKGTAFVRQKEGD